MEKMAWGHEVTGPGNLSRDWKRAIDMGKYMTAMISESQNWVQHPPGIRSSGQAPSTLQKHFSSTFAQRPEGKSVNDSKVPPRQHTLLSQLDSHGLLGESFTPKTGH